MPEKSHIHHWPEAAQLLHAKTKINSFHPDVLNLLNRPEYQQILIACSGGADSIYMLCQLWAQKKTLGIQLSVAHYNHRWRGEDSRSDAEFVEELSRQLECPFFTAERPEDVDATTETNARKIRLGFLRTIAIANKCQCIAFGHQQNDILETQLQRLARGSGTDGLAAPRPIHSFEEHPMHIRPILHLRANTIRAALREVSIIWREDVSNKDTKIPRNALRHIVVPNLQASLKHDVVQGAVRTRTLMEEDSRALDLLARKSFSAAFTGSGSLDRIALRAAPRALVRRALSAWLNTHGLIKSLNATAVDQLLDAIYIEKKRFCMSAGTVFVKVDDASVRIESAEPEHPSVQPCMIKAGESIELSTGATLSAESISVDTKLYQGLLDGIIDVQREAYIASTSDQIFQVRAWQPGDSYRALGAPGKKKLKKWFIDRQIPRRERNLLPLVVTSSGTIAWVPGLPPADDLKVSTATKVALKLTYQSSKSL